MRKLDIDIIVQILGIVISTVVFAISFNVEELMTFILFFIIVALLLVLLFKKKMNISNKDIELNTNRNLWLKQTILKSIGSDQNITHNTSAEYDWQLAIETDTLNTKDFAYQELGIEKSKEDDITLIPDIEAAENEMIKAEERASLLIGATVILPILFALAHIFRYVSTSVFILELQATFIVGQLITISQSRSYNIAGWTEVMNTIKQEMVELPRKGRRLLNGLYDLFGNPFANELGLELEPKKTNHAIASGASALKMVSTLSPHHRTPMLNNYLNGIEKLPEKERILNIRWQAYRGRLLLVSSTGVALAALLASLAQFTFPILWSEIYPIQSTPYLYIGLGILTISLNWIVTRIWLKPIQQIRWVVIWIMEYYLVLVFASALYF